MKELSIEQKVKAYNEAIKRIKSKLKNGKDHIFYENDIVELFPELKESEEDKMKRIISDILLIDSDEIREILDANNVLMQDIDAWLEKQGEHAKFRDSIQVGDKVTRNQDGVLVNLSQLKRVAKPADKVEPKFHEGDWVVYKNDICQIVKREEGCNKLVTIFGIEKELVNERNLSTARLWTIQDAKDGDVLSYRDGKWIFIYKEKIDDNTFSYHTLYSTIHQDLTIDDAGFTLLVDAIIPATKEQRDLLFQNMKEAGYEWDAGNKELKKIEQKPAWSEEDEKQARQIERIVHDDGCTQKLQKQIAYWLKSLKDRVQPQPKQEWSEEDINMIDWLIRCCEKEHEELCNDKYGHQDIVSELKSDCRKKWDWLESLKNRVAPQSQWKPSDEQIEALLKLEEMHVLEHEKNQENAHLYMVVKSIREHLLKLRE